MTMTKNSPIDDQKQAFWLSHGDPTQAAVHLALQWLAYVYPASELQIDKTLISSLPYADSDLASRSSMFFDQNDVEQHVEALEWISATLSVDQVPFLVETCWRLLLVDHELPTHAPLALRIMGQVLNISEERMLQIGESVFREYVETDENHNRVPLLPLDPRYLDRIEWRLYGHSSMTRRSLQSAPAKKKSGHKFFSGFSVGLIVGAGVMAGLVFGPLQLGRLVIPTVMHEQFLNDQSQPQLAIESPQMPEEVVELAPAVTLDSAVVETTEAVAVDSVPPAEQIESAGPAVETVEPAIESPLVETPVESVNTDVLPVTETASGVEPAVNERVLMQVTASILNVRKEASVGSEILIKLAGGAKVWAYPETADGFWILVKVEGETGYASARFLEEITP